MLTTTRLLSSPLLKQHLFSNFYSFENNSFGSWLETNFYL